MRGLSKRAWNNVLIFAMLGLIVVFNFDRLFPVDSSNRAMLIAEHEFILSMQINELTFERIGTGEVDNIPYVIHKGDLFVLDEPSFFDLVPPTSGGFDNK